MSWDRTTTLGYSPPLLYKKSALKLLQHNTPMASSLRLSDEWQLGLFNLLTQRGLVLERSRALMIDSPTRSQVCLHNSCFGENIIKGSGGFVTSLPSLALLLPGDGKQVLDGLCPWALTCRQSNIPPWRWWMSQGLSPLAIWVLMFP